MDDGVLEGLKDMNMKTLTLLFACAALSASAFNYEALSKTDALSDTNGAPLASVWQDRNRAVLAAATADDEMESATASAAAALKLLSSVRPAYATDPLDAFRIAEVTHWVMVDAGSSWYELWREHRAANRRVWTEALLATALGASDDYVKIFCLDQLRWCAFPCQAEKIELVGAGGGRAVRDFAQMIVRELRDCRRF